MSFPFQNDPPTKNPSHAALTSTPAPSASTPCTNIAKPPKAAKGKSKVQEITFMHDTTDETFSDMAADGVEADFSMGEMHKEWAPLVSDPDEREPWDNGESVTNAQQQKVLALCSDYEKEKEMNIIQNSRYLAELGLTEGSGILLAGPSKGREVQKLSADPPSDSDDYDDDYGWSLPAFETIPRVMRRWATSLHRML